MPAGAVKFAEKVLTFIKREKVYALLLIFVMIFNLLPSSGGQVVQKEGLGNGKIISEEKIIEVLGSDPFIAVVVLFLFFIFALFALAGIALDISYLYLNGKGSNPIGRTRAIGKIRWDLWDMCKTAIIFLFAQRAMFLAGIFLFGALPYLRANNNFSLMLSATSADIIGIGAVFYFVLKDKGHDVFDLGLTAKRFFGNIKYGISAYVGLIPVLASVMLLTALIFKVFNISAEPQAIVTMLQEESHTPTLIYMGLFSAFFGPVIEEVFFRGFVYGALRQKLGIFTGIVSSAVFFAFVHANLASLLPIICLGMLLAYMYEKTGSLIPSMTVHVMHNSVTLGILLFIKGAAA